MISIVYDTCRDNYYSTCPEENCARSSNRTCVRLYTSDSSELFGVAHVMQNPSSKDGYFCKIYAKKHHNSKYESSEDSIFLGAQMKHDI